MQEQCSFIEQTLRRFDAFNDHAARQSVQTRILWLNGLDPGNANTKERYVYIHGTNAEAQLGVPASHGCVRMSNLDVIDLYDVVAEGDRVTIEP